jgi:hypothetical protein
MLQTKQWILIEIEVSEENLNIIRKIEISWK